MYDVAFKPRLLTTLITDYLPNQNHPFSNPSQLSKVVSLIKTHSLLSESVTEQSINPKSVKAWKSSVTSWVDRILLLISSPSVNFFTFRYYAFWVFITFAWNSRQTLLILLPGFVYGYVMIDRLFVAYSTNTYYDKHLCISLSKLVL
jgi:hypothetical protein